ncbi:5'-methylthioadenosine/S-adenosylhomocysteine nucleosidase [Planomonospora venezuelensis]|uniref:Nucleoside phosphorylase n=1 Tax=Planomonospora venezuelensis TaxID=1999 RepID=A0A841D517_PLAVE|nr:nucleoside phosphorylase [Planomonospora venezuelensis]GIM99048.1 hypothetical protein Pve01_07070 [Planomonospora venezuelensis]
MRKDKTVVVITPMNLEYKAMRARLMDLRQQWHLEGTSFETGMIPGTPWQVVIMLAGEGNVNTAVLAERAITSFNPRALLVVGIAGGLKDDIDLGDVVVATWVHGYHGGKEESEEFRARPRGWGAAHFLEQVARMVDVRGEWATLLPSPANPKVHFKPIAAGEVVLNSRSSTLAVQLRKNYDDAAAIEMESAGAGIAAHLNTSLPVLTIRGISDKADGEKHLSDAKGLQPQAASHAAAFATAFLKDLAEAEDAMRSNSPVHNSGSNSEMNGKATWRPLDEALPTFWLSELNLGNSSMSAAIELHVIPADQTLRMEARRLSALNNELAALGRAEQLFAVAEGLRIEDPAMVIAPSGSGLAVTRDGQRSAWQSLPKDMLGAVLDPIDLVGRLTALLTLLAKVEVPISMEVGVAVGLTRTFAIAEGRVSDLPRTSAPLRISSTPVRVPADDVLPFPHLASNPQDIAEEMCARLLQAFRRIGR